MSTDLSTDVLGPVEDRNEFNAVPEEIGSQRHSLTIVIPALNEEESIGNTIRRCLGAREEISRAAGVGRFEIIVVSDGSTDRTAAIAQDIAKTDSAVSVIVFPKNRGYGAAIKAGFEHGSGDLVAFLDADGTCAPQYFSQMCRAIDEDNAVIALGSRMGANSRMPRIRRLGNRLYAVLLGAMTGRAVEDVASGMRVIRRDALPSLYPLPDGLNFTPAMSARALMMGLEIAEVPMDYAERVGESKLHVLRDGLRFFSSIFDALILYRPGRIFAFLSLTCLVVAAAWGLYPTEYYLRNAQLEEWMIYRILLSGFLLTCSFVFITTSAFADQFLSLLHEPRRTFIAQLVARFGSSRILLAVSLVSAIVAIFLVTPGLIQYARTGEVFLHWSRVVAAVFLLQVSVIGAISTVLNRFVRLWKQQLDDKMSNHRRMG